MLEGLRRARSESNLGRHEPPNGDGASAALASMQRNRRTDWLARAIVSGFSASVLMLLSFFLALGLIRLLDGQALDGQDRAFWRWLHALANNPLIDTAGSVLYVAVALHLGVSLTLALLYAYLVAPLRLAPGWLMGTGIALAPWLLSVTVFFPAVGAGLLGAALGAGFLPLIGNLVLHLVYGAALGRIYGPLGDWPADSLTAPDRGDPAEFTASVQAAAARGVLVGAALGLAVGVSAIVVLGFSSPNVEVPRAALLLASVLAGSAFGGALSPIVAVGPEH